MTAEKMITKGEKSFSGKKNERSDLAVCGQPSVLHCLHPSSPADPLRDHKIN